MVTMSDAPQPRQGGTLVNVAVRLVQLLHSTA
jgi:hypothetical protein